MAYESDWGRSSYWLARRVELLARREEDLEDPLLIRQKRKRRNSRSRAQIPRAAAIQNQRTGWCSAERAIVRKTSTTWTT